MHERKYLELLRQLMYQLAFFWLALGYVAPSARAQPPSNSPDYEIDTTAIVVASAAFKDFSRRNRQWRCFRVRVYVEDNKWHVDFLPTDNTRDIGGAIVVNTSKCGASTSYVLTDSGKIIERSYGR